MFTTAASPLLVPTDSSVMPINSAAISRVVFRLSLGTVSRNAVFLPKNTTPHNGGQVQKEQLERISSW